jgi:Fe-S-cluster containining protein
MKLTHTEAAFFEASGVDLTRTDLSSSSVNDAEPEHYYYLWQDCSFLKQVGSAAICSIYEDERRPKVCSNFEQGSRACLGMRDPGYTAPRRPPSESDFMM